MREGVAEESPGRAVAVMQFRYLWASQSVSQMGSSISGVGIALICVASLNATPFQMGVLSACGTFAFITLGLPAGALVERWPKVRVLVTSDLVRLAIFAILAATYLTGHLRVEHLFLSAFLTGAASVFFDIAYQAYLPSIVERESLIDGNSKLETSRSVAAISGPAAAGQILRYLGPAGILVVDGVSYLLSACLLLGARVREAPLDCSSPRERLTVAISAGVAYVFRSSFLRRVIIGASLGNLFGTMIVSQFVYYGVRELRIAEGAFALALSAGATGGLAGALTSGRMRRLMGTRVISFGAFMVALASIANPIAFFLSTPVAVVVLAIGQFVMAWAAVVFNVAQVSYRQGLCDQGMLARMNSVMRTAIWGMMPVGAVASGLIAGLVGPLGLMIIASCGLLLSALPLIGLGATIRELKNDPE